MTKPSQEQFNAFADAPRQFSTLLAQLSEQHIYHQPDNGEWSIHEVIIHIADAETVGFWRFRRTLAEPGSTLAVYDEAAWATQLSYTRQRRDLALTLFTALRASSVELLRSLPDEAWERTSIHPERGVISLYDLFLVYLEHSTLHLQQIEQLTHQLPA